MAKHNIDHTEAFPITPRGLRDAIKFWMTTEYESRAKLAVAQSSHYQNALPIRFRDQGDGNLHGYSGNEIHHIGRPLLLICARSPLQKKRGLKS